jgi:hypothetical protein
VKKHGTTSWKDLSEALGGRKPMSIRQRYFNTLNTEVKKGKWDNKEDWILAEFVRLKGIKRWQEASKFITGRNSKQLHTRWRSLQKKKDEFTWTKQEEAKIKTWIKK